MNLTIPGSITHEHQDLYRRLGEVARLEGPVGEAAKAVARILQPHFAREEEIALPPLALLKPLAEGLVTTEMRDVLSLTRSLKEELPRMLAEHQQIIGALQVFGDVSRRESRPECAELAEDLILHTRTEEEILYPAALLVGEFVRSMGSATS